MVAIILTLLILVPNLLLRPPVIDSVLFALAIAVGITPQLLPAVVSTSLATGSRRLAGLKVLVKRLVCIEDPGRVPSGAGCAGTDVRPGARGPAALGQDVRGRRGVDARHRRGDRDVRRHAGRRDEAELNSVIRVHCVVLWQRGQARTSPLLPPDARVDG